MERFYFNTYDGRSTIKDSEGLMLPSIGEARGHALHALADMAHDALRNGPVREIQVKVRDEDGPCLDFTLTLQVRDRT